LIYYFNTLWKVDEVGSISTILSSFMFEISENCKKDLRARIRPALQHQRDFCLTATLQNWNTAAPSFDCSTAALKLHSTATPQNRNSGV
jgi:hypothetical protein